MPAAPGGAHPVLPPLGGALGGLWGVREREGRGDKGLGAQQNGGMPEWNAGNAARQLCYAVM